MSIPYFLRAFRIIVTLQNGDKVNVATTHQPLQCMFSIEYPGPASAYAFCNLIMYNLAPDTSTAVRYGDLVEIHAGYEFNDGASPQALIFRGHVYQPMWERENVVDVKTTLRCYQFLLEDQGQFVSLTLPAGTTPAQAFKQVVAASGLTVGYVDYTALPTAPYIKAKVFHGRPTALLAEIAKETQSQLWFDSFGVSLAVLAKRAGLPPVITYTPSADGINVLPASVKDAKPTIIGTPRQTQQGVELTVLMDSEVRIGMPIRLVNTAIIQAPRVLGDPNASVFPPQSPDGIYAVVSLRYRGNTRVGEWYTEIVGVTNPLLAYAFRKPQ